MAAPPPPPPQEGVLNTEALHLNDEIVDMCMLLDYENRFCTKELKPMPRTFFAYPAPNPAHQFKYFSQLVAFGLAFLNIKADWDEFDDPTTVMTSMQVALKDASIQVPGGMGKLKSGHGDAVCQVLHTLMGEALRRVSFEFHAPTYPDEGMADEADVDSDAEIHSVGEDEMPGDGEEDDLMYQEDAPKPPEDDENDHQVLQANVDPKEWLLEVERVSSRLKVQMPNDSKEWRTHLQQTKQYKQVIENQFPASKVQLDKLVAQLSQAMDRIKSKEAFINTQFDHRAVDYRQQQEELTQVQQQYTELNEVVMNLQIELKNVSEELDVVKNEMEEKSSTVTDTTPIVKMKDAFKRLRADTRQLEVQIGVVSHTLMQAKLRQRPNEDRKRGVYGDSRATEEDQYDEQDP